MEKNRTLTALLLSALFLTGCAAAGPEAARNGIILKSNKNIGNVLIAAAAAWISYETAFEASLRAFARLLDASKVPIKSTAFYRKIVLRPEIKPPAGFI